MSNVRVIPENEWPDWLAEISYKGTVSSLFPGDFEKYVRIPHRPFLAGQENRTDERVYLDWSQLSRDAGSEYVSGERIDKASLLLGPQGGQKYWVKDGEIDAQLIDALLRKLTEANDAPLKFYFGLAMSIAQHGNQLYEGSSKTVDDVNQFIVSTIGSHVKGPERIWTDGSWMTFTDYDDVATYVAGSSRLMDSIVETSEFSAHEVSAGSSLL